MNSITSFVGDNQSIDGTGTYTITLLNNTIQKKPIKFFSTTLPNITLQDLGEYLVNVDVSNLSINGIINVSACITSNQVPQSLSNIGAFVAYNITDTSSSIQLLLDYYPLQYIGPFFPITVPITIFVEYY